MIHRVALYASPGGTVDATLVTLYAAPGDTSATQCHLVELSAQCTIALSVRLLYQLVVNDFRKLRKRYLVSVKFIFEIRNFL